MKEIPNLDELLNCYIDDELPLRQHTEIQRLVAHDEKIAHRLEELRQCKILISSLPVAEAPPQILANAKASIAGPKVFDKAPSILVKESLTPEEKVGARHLLGRKVFAAAAMFGLVAVLAAVVYSILAPTVPSDTIVVESITEPQPVDLTYPTPVRAVVAPFSGRLELYTNNLPAVVSIINKAIEDNIPSDEWIASDQSSIRQPHRLICTSESLNLLLARLDDIWSKLLDSATLSIDTKVFGSRVVVEDVTAEQIDDIINQENSTRRIEVARDFAVLNNITEHLPGREILTAIEDNPTVDLIIPPKPSLTWNKKTSTKTVPKTGLDKNIDLTIVVTSSN